MQHEKHVPLALYWSKGRERAYNSTSFRWVVLFPPIPHGMVFLCLFSCREYCNDDCAFVGRVSVVLRVTGFEKGGGARVCLDVGDVAQGE
jgi:hypothetical protein